MSSIGSAVADAPGSLSAGAASGRSRIGRRAIDSREGARSAANDVAASGGAEGVAAGDAVAVGEAAAGGESGTSARVRA